ncbi:MAG TPA: type IV secretory system conjugative DNA transfer family protein [Phycisphaerae bacterium]|nr:type IV secretory system conjugative DNA transfer family protein [Phycisphaerae bacterium]
MPAEALWPPELPLLRFGNHPADTWTMRDAFEGAFILGQIGSGKTSGSGRMLARAFLEHNFGGLILTAKENERDLWIRYAREAGREHHLCIVQPGGRWKLNFLDYETKRPQFGAGLIENLVHLFYIASYGSTKRNDDSKYANFWENAGKELLRNVFRVLERSREVITISDMVEFVMLAPKTLKELEVGRWKESNFGKWLAIATEVTRGTPKESELIAAQTYWLNNYPGQAADTRACVITGMTALADAFYDRHLHDMFCTETTLTPEAAMDGAIIIIDLPVHRFKIAGSFAQALWKYQFQTCVERRADPDGPTRRPVFLWADEAQHFFTSHDSIFQATARSNRCSTVYITQNLPNFYAAGGGYQARDAIDGFLGCFSTKVFHCNNDPASNNWAAEQIGKSLQYRSNFSTSTSTNPNGSLHSVLFPSQTNSGGMQEVIDYEVQPSIFQQLRTGADLYKGNVDAYFVKAGARFSQTGKHYQLLCFKQE